MNNISEEQEVIFDGSDSSIDYEEESQKLESNSSNGSSDLEYVKLAPGTNKIRFLDEGEKKFQKFEKQEDGSYDVSELEEEEVEKLEDRREQIYSDLYDFVNDTTEAENIDELRDTYEENFPDTSVEAIEELFEELDEVETELDKISKQVQYPVELVDGEFIAGDDRITETDDDTTYIYSVTYASTKSSQWGQLVDLAKKKGGLKDEVVIIKRDGTGNNTQYSILDPESL